MSITLVAERITSPNGELIMFIVARINYEWGNAGVAHGFLAGKQRSLCGKLDRMRRDVHETYNPIECQACERKLQALRSKPTKGLDGLLW
tara:strand:+ start:81 stop:350 length:270 start_codon:yes stop_codon:yes gene_type:complete